MSKFLTLIFSIVLITSCKKPSDLSLEKSFPGYYKVTKITSNLPVDLNNDGIKTIDLYSEISRPFSTLDGQQLSFYNFESRSNYAEVKAPNAGKFIDFNFPHQYINYLNNDNPYLIGYINQFQVYSYNINKNSNITIKGTNPEYTNQFGEIESLILEENGKLLVSIKKKVYDFVNRAWQIIKVSVEYSKIL